MSSSGASATSGSRLFMSMRRAASCCQPLQLIAVPRGARTGRGPAGFMDPVVFTCRLVSRVGDRVRQSPAMISTLNPDARRWLLQEARGCVQRAVLVFVVVFGCGRYAGLRLSGEKGGHRAAGPSARRG